MISALFLHLILEGSLSSSETTLGTVKRIERPHNEELSTYYIDESGERVFAFSLESNSTYTWDVSAAKPINISFGGAYDPVNHEPMIAYKGVKIPNPGEMLSLPTSGTNPTLIGNNEPSIYRTGVGGNGIHATFFGAATIGPTGPVGGRVLLWEREFLKYIRYDPSSRILLVSETDLPNPYRYRTYRLGINYKQAERIPLPSYMQQLPKLQIGVVSLDMRRGLKTIGGVRYEYNLRTGTRTALPVVEDGGYTYAGNDLYAAGRELSAYDRASNRLYPIGPYQIAGSSPTGNLVILRHSFERNHPFLYIYQRSGSK